MKVVLDLDRLLREGHITAEDRGRLTRLAERDTGAVAFNLLVGLGVVAVAGAMLALVPTAATATLLGALIMAGGVAVLKHRPNWLLLGNICVLVGALMLGGGILILSNGLVLGYLGVSAICLAGALFARSALLVALGVLAITGAAGAGTFYGHATYMVEITRPSLTILVCAIIALGTYLASFRVELEAERLCLIAARTALFVANMGFWIGSLWGDDLSWRLQRETDPAPPAILVSPAVFSLAWAVALVAIAIWAVRANRRWAFNVAAIFGAIHFYTQWFEVLGAEPGAVLVAGLITLGFAFALWRWNVRPSPSATPPTTA